MIKYIIDGNENLNLGDIIHDEQAGNIDYVECNITLTVDTLKCIVLIFDFRNAIDLDGMKTVHDKVFDIISGTMVNKLK